LVPLVIYALFSNTRLLIGLVLFNSLFFIKKNNSKLYVHVEIIKKTN